jgi:hypothetical protein
MSAAPGETPLGASGGISVPERNGAESRVAPFLDICGVVAPTDLFRAKEIS